MTCVHLRINRCSMAQAKTVGQPVTRSMCANCPHYEGCARGLGDVVATVARVTGVASVVKAVTGGNCGCNSRKQMLNEKFPLRNT